MIKLGPGKRFQFNYDYCKGCGMCVAECPCGAIKMEAEEIQEKSALAGRRRCIILGPLHEGAGRKVPLRDICRLGGPAAGF